MLYIDTETCGFHGPTVLIQYQEDEGPIILHEVWRRPIQETLDLIRWFCEYKGGLVGFNWAFDWFHLCQTYTTLSLFPDKDIIPLVAINEYAYFEKEARDGDCLKPHHVFDLMTHARKGPYQSLMDRDEIRIKRVPTMLAFPLADILKVKIPLKDVYFARKSDPTERWKVYDLLDDMGDVIPDFKDVVLKFAPSSALKALAVDALGLMDVTVYEDVSVPDHLKPVEDGYAPYALAPFFDDGNNLRFPTPANWWGKWPVVIERHATHWAFNHTARQYAEKDVEYTHRLYDFFGRPPMDDDDSVLACLVGAARWKGYAIDMSALSALREEAKARRAAVERIAPFGSPEVCKKYLYEVMSDTERFAMRVNGKVTTKGIILEELAKWKLEEVCNECFGAGCPKCHEGFIESGTPHPVAERAKQILEYRQMGKEIELYDKLLLADRLHASFVVVGTLSSRMSGGGGGINAQGIKRAEYVRSAFKLAFEDEQLDGGDFDGFEVTIADAVYKDPKLRARLEAGFKIHGLFGTKLFPPLTYEQIMKTKGLPGEEDKYTRSKNGVFAMLYGGDENTLQTRVGVTAEAAAEAFRAWVAEFDEWGKARKRIYDMFCSMRQPGGIGTKVEWNEPAEYIESLLGFRRYYTLENTICKVLFDLAEKPPKEWAQLQITVRRRDRDQLVVGAVRSALFASAFAIQAGNMRSAANHEIQSTGGQLTKRLEARIWTVQPAGIYPWFVRPLNVHDEVMAALAEEVSGEVAQIVKVFEHEHKTLIPLIGIKWKTGLASWASK